MRPPEKMGLLLIDALANMLRKLDLSSRAAAAAWGVRTGLV